MIFGAVKLKKIWQAFKREDGNASIEFVILFPALMTLFLSSFEVSVFLLRSSLLEKSLDTTVRELRLGIVNPKTAAELKETLCDRASVLPNCLDTMKVELLPVPTTSFSLPSGSIKCVDIDAEIDPATTVNFGQPNDIMIVRACAKVDPFFVTTPWVMGMQKVGGNPGDVRVLARVYGMDTLPTDTSGQYAVTAVSTFVNEP